MDDGQPATCYADSMLQQSVTILENVPIARDTYRLRFQAAEMAERFLPGQFLMLRLEGWDDPLIARPLALFDTVLDESGRPAGLDVVYLVKGKLTTRLARLGPGQRLQVWGPLGNGFAPLAARHLIMVAGGIGQTPFLALGREALGKRSYGSPPRPAPVVPRVTLCYGARSADLLAGVPEFEAAGIEVQVATDDGTRGLHGLVTDLLRRVLAETDAAVADTQIVCCGPEPMMAAVARVARESQVACRVSLETPMACGIGICFTCVTRVRVGDGWDYRRTCVEGPVFAAESIVW